MAGLALAAGLVSLASPVGGLRAQDPPGPDTPQNKPLRPFPSAPTPAADPGVPVLPLASPVPAEPTVVFPSPSAPPRAIPHPSSSPATDYAPDGTLSDPEGAARAFLAKSVREADEAIKALNQEAETLRARLAKVEAGLSRWESVKTALEVDKRRAAPVGREVSPTRRQIRSSLAEDSTLTPKPVDRRSPFDLDAPPEPTLLEPVEPGLTPPPRAPAPASPRRPAPTTLPSPSPEADPPR